MASDVSLDELHRMTPSGLHTSEVAWAFKGPHGLAWACSYWKTQVESAGVMDHIAGGFMQQADN